MAQYIPRCSTTEPNTPTLESPFKCEFAKLVPLNKYTESVLETTLKNEPNDYHRNFIQVRDFQERPTACFILSLTQLPEYPQLGWRIGKGRDKLRNRGVDFLLTVPDDDDNDLAGIHARFHWQKAAGGFFVTADNKRGKSILLNGDTIEKGSYQRIPKRNMIAIGKCLFKLHFVDFSSDEDDQFQEELKEFMRNVCDDSNPLVLPTPREHDVTFGEWQVQWAISQGGFGTVYMVTHSRDGRPAAAKHLLKTRRNAEGYHIEIQMATLISALSHVSCYRSR